MTNMNVSPSAGATVYAPVADVNVPVESVYAVTSAISVSGAADRPAASLMMMQAPSFQALSPCRPACLLSTTEVVAPPVAVEMFAWPNLVNACCNRLLRTNAIYSFFRFQGARGIANNFTLLEGFSVSTVFIIRSPVAPLCHP